MMNFEERKHFSEEKIGDLRREICQLESVQPFKNLCIFVCGSFGRREAHPKSDLDIFLIRDDLGNENGKKKANKIYETLLFADLIKVNKKLGFPPFSKDGKFLKIHSLGKILENLGSPSDDFENYFTTRLLLILESVPVFNEKLYENIIDEAVKTYFRDYEEHLFDFKPVFLLNDILRFWKTMCLNYEHKRNQPIDDLDEKAKISLKNIKLKFSRMTTCYSMILPMSREGVKPRDIVNWSALPPLERMKECVKDDECQKVYNQLINQYLLLLARVSEENIIEVLKNEESKKELLVEANQYTKYIYEYLKLVGDDEILRYIAV